jgi:sarcosine oxidase subunit gamma
MGSGCVAELARQSIAQMLGLDFGSVVAKPGLAVTLIDPVCQALVTGVPEDDSFRARVSGALGFALPAAPNRVAGEATRALAIAPGQWLIVSDDPAAGTLTARLGEALDQGGGFVSCQRDGMAIFELAGAAARDILAMGCALDLDDSAMAPGRCARTPFAAINTIVYALGSRERWRLHLDRAFARHMVEWLQRAATSL